MSKILKSIVGLVIIGSSLAFAAAPAKAESKPAQCQRFKQAIVTLNRQLAKGKYDKSQSYLANVDRYLSTAEPSLKQLQSRQFSDARIRGLQQATLDLHVKLYNDIANIGDAVEQRDKAAAQSAFQQLITAADSANGINRQIAAYCGRSK
jgi:hypothetical protein